ncbi:MAG: Asp-tRNA(Asn)/Glu-tRNA(Gln) amidotransferase subunit GatA [bacterium]
MSAPPATYSELRRALDSGNRSSAELTEDCLARIRRRDSEWNAFLTVDDTSARAAAAAADARRADARPLGPLDGVPVAVKDNLVTAGLRTTCASRYLADYVPPRDATVVARLRAAGAVILGKANLDEFAMGSSNEHSAFGAVRNPHDPSRVPGGSSGGSCAAVAGALAPLAIGSDTGGSVRLPASFCGVVGVKPTYGRVSRSGLVAFGSSLDQPGPVARDVAGAAALLAVMSGHDPDDATSSLAPVPDWTADLSGDVGSMKIGVVRDLLGDGVDDEVRTAVERAIDALRAAGARIVDVELPHARFGVAAYYVLSSAEASANLSRFDGVRYGARAADVSDLETLYERSRSEGFGAEVKRRILIGTFALSAGYYDAYYARAQKARRLIRADYGAAFVDADVLLSPVAPTPAFRLGERAEDPLAMYLTDAMTIPASLAGVPALSVPVGISSGRLPIGAHLTAPAFAEGRLFRAAAALERAFGPAPWPASVAEEAA